MPKKNTSKTVMIATLGPASEDRDMIKKLAQKGVDWFRINASHGSHEEYKKIVADLRSLNRSSNRGDSSKKTCFLDLQGPKIRLGEIEEIAVKKNAIVWLVNKKNIQKNFTAKNKKIIQNNKIDHIVPLPYLPAHKHLAVGNRLLIEDGKISSRVIRKENDLLLVRIENEGMLKRHKGVNLPDTLLPSQNSWPKKDREDFIFALKELKIHEFALSFVETAEDIHRVRKLGKRYSKKPLILIAKIERPKALENLDEIAEASDWVMVARGDLGVETSLEEVPLHQLKIIQRAHHAGKKVIIATQMMDSMIHENTPTRAEVTDAAVAVLEGADAVMLSNETAVGSNPLRTVEILEKILQKTENSGLHFKNNL